MERKQTETPSRLEHPEPAGGDVIPEDPGYGEGAASALASLKRLERDRANATPADEIKRRVVAPGPASQPPPPASKKHRALSRWLVLSGTGHFELPSP